MVAVRFWAAAGRADSTGSCTRRGRANVSRQTLAARPGGQEGRGAESVPGGRAPRGRPPPPCRAAAGRIAPRRRPASPTGRPTPTARRGPTGTGPPTRGCPVRLPEGGGRPRRAGRPKGPPRWCTGRGACGGREPQRQRRRRAPGGRPRLALYRGSNRRVFPCPRARRPPAAPSAAVVLTSSRWVCSSKPTANAPSRKRAPRTAASGNDVSLPRMFSAPGRLQVDGQRRAVLLRLFRGRHRLLQIDQVRTGAPLTRPDAPVAEQARRGRGPRRPTSQSAGQAHRHLEQPAVTDVISDLKRQRRRAWDRRATRPAGGRETRRRAGRASPAAGGPAVSVGARRFG